MFLFTYVILFNFITPSNDSTAYRQHDQDWRLL